MLIETALAAEEAAHTADPGLLGTFGVSWKLFAAQLFNFAILLFVLKRWVYQPLLRVLDERKRKIEEGLERAKRAEITLAEASMREGEVIAKANAEARDILANAKAKGDQERQAILARTKSDIERERQELSSGIQREREEARAGLSAETADLVTAAAERVIGKSLDAKMHRELIASAIRDLENARS
jgi:F-type H+-transporting ATPase subunit b